MADEQLIPNYLTIDPATGEVGADFTGIIHALGLILPAAPNLNTPQGSNELVWTALDGLTRAVLLAGDLPGPTPNAVLQIGTFASGPASASEVTIAAADDTGAPQASLNVNQIDEGNGRVLANAGALDYTIIDSTGFSSFVLSAAGGPNPLAIIAGTSSFVFAASTTANSVITHGLGRAPKIVLLTLAANPPAPITLGYDTVTVTQFTARALADSALTATVTFGWLAVG